MKKILIFVALIIVILVMAVSFRHRIIIAMMFPGGAPPALLEAVEEGESVTWHDDYFIVKAIDSSTFAIAEPRYYQQNVNYLLVGSERAILFDAGSGYRDINTVVSSLTDLPVTFIPSHFHFDHVGNGIKFERTALVDLPHIRSRVKEGRLKLQWREHLGSAEGYEQPVIEVAEWLTPNGLIDLGDRKLRVLYTPGHTDDSVSLLDTTNAYLFSGDFIYVNELLFAFIPTSNMGDYIQGVDTVLEAAPPGLRIFGAHRRMDEQASPGIPEQGISAVSELGDVLSSIRSGELKGEGFYPVSYPVNSSQQLVAEPRWLQDWEPRYPDLNLKQGAK